MSGRPDHPDATIAAALARLGEVDAAAATDARSALDWIVGEGGLEAMSQYGLQQFCWYELPFKWLVAPDVREEIVAALGRFFDVTGLPRYAALCRSEQTREVLHAWRRDVGEGYRAYRLAVEGSGLEPPALPELAWGAVMGADEFDAFWSVALALEVAVVAGEIRPGSVGWRDRQQSIVRTHLSQPREELFGSSHLQAVWTARLAEWIEGPLGLASLSRARTQVVGGVANQLLHPIPPPRGLARSTRPLIWFLDRVDADEAAGGVALTARGHLPRAFAVDAVHAFPSWWSTAPIGRAPRREDEVEQLVRVHLLARRLRLVREGRGRLVLTPSGRARRRDPMALWDALTERLGSARGFEAAAHELALAILVQEVLVEADALVAEVVVVLTESGWQDGGSGEPVPVAAVQGAVDALVAELVLLGWARERGGVRTARRIRLTEIGRVSALAALRRRALAPRAIRASLPGPAR